MASKVRRGNDLDRSQRGICLLSLDGGGIRGLSELIIIEEIMNRVKVVERLDEVPKPASYFNLIGGTSTGGLIAILLGRLRLSAADAINCYETLAKRVFSEKKEFFKDGIFKASNLEKAIKNVIEANDPRKDSNAKMFEPDTKDPAKCKAFVCAIGGPDITHAAGPALFRTYKVEKNDHYHSTIWEAARATSAVPTYLKRVPIGPPGSAVDYIDAGSGYNNPGKQVVNEAVTVFEEDAPVSCFLSIGTGQTESVGLAKSNTFQNIIPTGMIDVLKKIATDAGKVAEEMEKRYGNAPGLFTRLNVNRGLGSILFDEWNMLNHVRCHTHNYLRLEAVSRRVDRVVSMLCGSSTHPKYSAGQLAGIVRPSSQGFQRINIPPNRVSHFVTRPKLLNAIEDQLLSHTPPSDVVLLGMGGSGKTQIALEICQLAESRFGFMAAVWIDASSPATVQQSHRVIAKKILKGWQDDANLESVIPHIHDTMRTWHQSWLLIFDNFDNPAAFQGPGIRPYIPQCNHVRVLFTSRHLDSSRRGKKIEVSAMAEAEGLELLLRREPTDREEAADGMEVALTLGFLALALDQAGAYMQVRALSPREFLTHYHERKKAVLKYIPDEWEYFRGVEEDEKERKLSAFTTWELSFRYIKHHIVEKDRFLSLAAFFDVSKISERYFKGYSTAQHPEWMQIFRSNDEWDSYKLSSVLVEFQKLSLIQLQCSALQGQSFSIHPVVRDWIRLRKIVDIQREVADEYIKILAEFLDSIDVIDDLPLKIKQETFSHVDKCVQIDKDLSLISFGKGVFRNERALLNFSHVYKIQWRFLEAQGLCERALSDEEGKRGPAEVDDLRELLAELYRWQGRWAASETLYDLLLDSKKKRLGVEHLETLMSMASLGKFQYDLGKFTSGKSMLQQSVAGFEDTVGLELDVAQGATRQLARVLAQEHQVEEAEQMLQRVLASQLASSQSHYEISITSADLAKVLSLSHRHDDAERLYKEALARREEYQGSNHPATLLVVYELAGVYRHQGRLDSAERLFERALAGQEEVLGRTHDHTLLTVSAFAVLREGQGRLDEAEGLYERALLGQEEALGGDHPDTLFTIHKFAVLREGQGRLDEAEGLYERALLGLEKTLGPDHPETLSTINNFAVLRERQGRLDEAETLYKRALEKTLGHDYPDTPIIVSNFAIVQLRQGRYNEAEGLFRRALPGQEKTLGRFHSDTLRTVHNFAVLREHQGRLDEAEKLYERALRSREKTLGHDHPDTLESRQYLKELREDRDKASKKKGKIKRFIARLT